MQCHNCKSEIIVGKEFCGFCGAENSEVKTREPLKIWEIIIGGVGGIFTLGIMGLGIFATVLAVWITGVDIFDGKDSIPMPIQNQEYKTFSGYECTSDCSGHEAGYEWAEDKGITDIDDCGGNSNSFIEGCEAYVDENN